MCPAICQGVITCFISNTVTNCHNIRPSLTILTDLNLTITEIVLSAILDVSSNLLNITFATKFQGNMTVFTSIV